jgi:hypothetical protein
MRRVQVRAWSLAFAVLVADAAILTMFAVTNTVMGQPQGVDRLIFGTFGLLLAALAPAALARIVGAPELQTAVQSMSRGSRVVGAGALAVKGALTAAHMTPRTGHGAAALPIGAVSGGQPGGPGGGPGTGSSGGALGGGPRTDGPSPAAGGPGGGQTREGATQAAAGAGTRHGSGAPQAGSGPPSAPTPASSTSRQAAGSQAGAATRSEGWQAALTRPTVGASRG